MSRGEGTMRICIISLHVNRLTRSKIISPTATSIPTIQTLDPFRPMGPIPLQDLCLQMLFRLPLMVHPTHHRSFRPRGILIRNSIRRRRTNSLRRGWILPIRDICRPPWIWVHRIGANRPRCINPTTWYLHPDRSTTSMMTTGWTWIPDRPHNVAGQDLQQTTLLPVGWFTMMRMILGPPRARSIRSNPRGRKTGTVSANGTDEIGTSTAVVNHVWIEAV